MSRPDSINLYGRVILTGQVRAVSGLHIGTSKDVLEIGGVDMPVIRNPADRRPYIPGSSLKGKMRSLWEKLTGVRQNFQVGKSPEEAKQVWIHICDDPECPVCSIYGTTGDVMKEGPTRLTVRDVLLDPDSLPASVVDYSEVKWEAAIDRVTSAATPRQMERVPAGAIFERMELVYSIYTPADVDRFAHVLTALQLVEDDFLGGQGSRGSGKVAFEHLTLTVKGSKLGYDTPVVRKPSAPCDAAHPYCYKDLAALLADKAAILDWIKENVPTNGGA
jgi:CRISPR-associated protein Csm3